MEREIEILEKLEGILDEMDITIFSDEREGEEGEARLYGVPYYDSEELVKEQINSNAYQNNYEIIEKVVDYLFESQLLSNEDLERLKEKVVFLKHIESVVNYLYETELTHFLENCECDDEITEKIENGENLNLCTCQANERHIVKNLDYLNQLL